jgi:hypothetical protein
MPTVDEDNLLDREVEQLFEDSDWASIVSLLGSRVSIPGAKEAHHRGAEAHFETAYRLTLELCSLKMKTWTFSWSY